MLLHADMKIATISVWTNYPCKKVMYFFLQCSQSSYPIKSKNVFYLDLYLHLYN